jgi:tRNA nucleotidyltransferase (CCA-adding enzyme)
MAGDTNIKLDLPKQVVQILERLGDFGYSAYICGECVRLLINGQTHNGVSAPMDFDLITNAEMPRILAIFDSQDGFNVNEDNLSRGELIVSVLGVAVSVAVYVNLDYELRRRYPLTIDAIAYSIEKGLHDPFGGVDALEKKEIVFVETGGKFNPHDVLAALAWFSGGEFTITEQSKQLILNNYRKSICVQGDLETVLMGRNVKQVFAEYSEILTTVIPELRILPPELLQFTFQAIGSSTPILSVRYALLFHELGKPDCYSKSWDEQVTYHGHAERSRIYARRIMTRLECSAEMVSCVEYIIKNHEKVLISEEENILDIRDEHPPGILKLLLLFNSAVSRAKSDEKTAMKFKKLSKMI